MLHDKFTDLVNDLNGVFYERADTIHHMLMALLSDSHMLMLGPPGTAKSMLINELCKRITDSTQFRWLMTAETDQDEILGPIDFLAYADQGIRKRIDTYSITTAHIVFLDEVNVGLL